MDNLFKNFLKNTRCKKNGICTVNPVLNAIDAVILNEIRQIAFYLVKLKELNFSNTEIMKETVFALSVNINDVDFDRESLYIFIKKLKNMKDKTKKFYSDKAKDINFSFEFIAFEDSLTPDKITYTDVIKSGENIIKQFYSNIDTKKANLINLITFMCKMASVNLVKLSSYTDNLSEFYFELLRFLSLINLISTREEKFIRRIKEFSKISYRIQSELDFELEKAYGKRQNTKIDTNIYKGKSILVAGDDLDELYLILQNTDDINVYIASSLIMASSYPKFNEFPNFKGLFGVGDDEFDFSNFTNIGPIYITKNSVNGLDTTIRGDIFTSKPIQSIKAKKINDIKDLKESAKIHEGFMEDVKNNFIEFNTDFDKVKKILDNANDKKVLIALGFISDNLKEKFKDYILINFIHPNETQGLHYALEMCKYENTCVYFSNCTSASIGLITSLLGKNLSGLYISECKASNINPHITQALQKNFNVEII